MDSFIIKAFTDNDYTDQDVDYLCIERSPEIIARYEQYVAIAKEASAKLENSRYLFNIRFWDDFGTFSCCFEETLEDGVQLTFLDITEEVTDMYGSTDGCLNAHMINVCASGSIYWTAQGKHCGTRYWSGGISIEEFKAGKKEEVLNECSG